MIITLEKHFVSNIVKVGWFVDKSDQRSLGFDNRVFC